jgi:hypothetical protein
MISLYPSGKSSDWKKDRKVFTVHSAYSSVLNLAGEDGRRYSLITDGHDFQPRSALIEAFPDLKASESVSVILEDVGISYDPTIVREKVNPLWRGLWLEWLDFLEEDMLCCLLPFVADPGQMLGLGPGSTPAGDDFIAGFATALGWSESEASWNSGEFTAILERVDSCTTWFSGEMVKDAVDGMIWLRGQQLCKALAGGSSSEALTAVGQIYGSGHLSGRAWLAGFSAGLERSLSHSVPKRNGGQFS